MKGVVLLLLIAGVAFPYVSGYHVEPVKAQWSGWTGRGDTVAQTVTCNFDSLSYVELFAGAKGNGGAYHVAVYDGNTLLTSSDGRTQTQSESWVTFDQWLDTVAFTKGKTLTIKFTRGGNDSLQYYYQSGDPYKYGVLIDPNFHDPVPLTWDLACRVYGRVNVVDRSFWGGFAALPFWNGWNEPNRRDAWRVYMSQTGWGSATFGCDWSINETLPGAWNFYDTDAHIWSICSTGARPIGILLESPSWITSREDSTPGGGYGPVPYAAPRRLWPGEGDTNYYARWLDTLLGHLDQLNPSLGRPADSVHTWIIWNEPNDTCVIDSLHRRGITGWWRRPNLDYTSGYDGLRGLCVLYMRACSVACRSIHNAARHDTDRILIGAMHRDTLRVPDYLVPGVDWLDMCYQVAEDSGWGIFWDGVAEHPYQEESFVLSPTKLEFSAETLRAVMHEHEDYSGELWNTEFGWNCRPWGMTREEDANNVCAAFAASLALQALPSAGGGYDGLCWWLPYYPGTGGWNWMWLWDDTLDEVSLDPQYGYYSFKQTRSTLAGKRFNGRVITGNALNDSLVRMYEFEDPATLKKTWVCWGTRDFTPLPIAELPARSDTAAATNLDYGDDPQPLHAPALTSGWLPCTLCTRPVFITEPDNRQIRRPDLVVDRIMVPTGAKVGSVMDIHAVVKNIGSDTTPDTVALDFLCDDSVFRHATSGWPIAAGDSYDFSFEINPIPSWMHGRHLFSARVNPGQVYVEKEGMDDNCGYARRYISYGPGGDIRGVICGSQSNSPLSLFSFETHSYEADTLGTVPAESARLVQWYTGNDTIVDGGDTTAWFCVNQAVSLDTSWLYLSGQSKYRFFIQVKDSWSESELIPDTVHPYVVFDTTGPTGSIGINGGARFVTSATCTLRLTAQDSCSGVAAMRFINTPRVDLVVGGSFTATAGSWEYENGEPDTVLRVAKLTATPVEARVSQFIPAESISAHAGDSCVLEASILAHVHEGDAAGSASFWFLSTRPDTWPVQETLFQLVDSASFSGRLLSLTGRSCLSKRFLLSPPSSDSEWVWRGGVVRVEAVAENGSGSVWTDNVRLVPYEPDSGHFWLNYDTLALWNIDSEPGMKVVRAVFMDSAGVENATPYADTIVLDPTAPVVSISLPDPGTIVNGALEVTGWAYDPVEAPGDTWFQRRTLTYRHEDSTNWLPCLPDSASFAPAYPDSGLILGPAVHLGYWNTTTLEDGAYYVLLAAFDSAGHVSTCTTWVFVSNEGGGGESRGGPEGGGSGMGEGSCYIGSATGNVLHVSDALDSLDAFAVVDSGSEAKVTAILEVADDSILVLDAANKRVHKLHRSGQHRRRLVSGLSQPADLKRDTNGNFYLVDRGLHRIGKFRSNGTLVFTRGGLGDDSLHFHSPEGIAVKGSLVYVADTKNDRVAVWDTSGNFKTIITGGFENPTAVFVTDEGAIYLTDGNDGKLKGITPLGGSIVAVGTTDSSKLKGLVPSENRHNLFSIASEPNKVYKLRIKSDDSLPGGVQSSGGVRLPKTLSLAQPFPNPARTRLNIAYALPRQTRVVLKLYDVAGKLVKTLANGEQKPGYYHLTWDRQDAKGRTCACGVYFCTLTAENQRFSTKIVLTE